MGILVLKSMRGHRQGRVMCVMDCALLEVLLVICIIPLLAAFVVPSPVGVRRGAEIDITRLMVAQGGTLDSRIILYRIQTGQYPRNPGIDERVGAGVSYMHERNRG